MKVTASNADGNIAKLEESAKDVINVDSQNTTTNSHENLGKLQHDSSSPEVIKQQEVQPLPPPPPPPIEPELSVEEVIYSQGELYPEEPFDRKWDSEEDSDYNEDYILPSGQI